MRCHIARTGKSAGDYVACHATLRCRNSKNSDHVEFHDSASLHSFNSIRESLEPITTAHRVINHLDIPDGDKQTYIAAVKRLTSLKNGAEARSDDDAICEQVNRISEKVWSSPSMKKHKDLDTFNNVDVHLGDNWYNHSINTENYMNEYGAGNTASRNYTDGKTLVSVSSIRSTDNDQGYGITNNVTIVSKDHPNVRIKYDSSYDSDESTDNGPRESIDTSSAERQLSSLVSLSNGLEKRFHSRPEITAGNGSLDLLWNDRDGNHYERVEKDQLNAICDDPKVAEDIADIL
jgi:hypothetical protein